MAQADSQGVQSDSGRADPSARPGYPRRWLLATLLDTPSWLSSMIVHMGLLILLASLTLSPGPGEQLANHLVVSSDDKGLEQLEQLDDPQPQKADLETMPEEVIPLETAVAPRAATSPVEDLSSSAKAIDLNTFGFDTAPRSDPMAVVGGFGGNAFSGRGTRARRNLVAKYGGTPESEKAVEASLKWLAAHQFHDGGWSFTHQAAPQCRRRCRNPGDQRFAGSRSAATGLALLPFLGAGQTHREGEYQKVVQAGLYFLRSQQDPQSGGLWESGGQMYSHGLAAIALCEAYAMTHDESLRDPAQKAINFICYAQDPVGGGWRYEIQQPGDTSVVGWQLMALKSGHLAYLVVPAATVKKASLFLDGVQSPSGVNYGYAGPGEGPSTEATTAIGWLCRMYLGRKRSDLGLRRGVEWLSARGPNRNLYYDYYATQVLHHWEGKAWTTWNKVMRDQLVAAQSRRGHEAGSWFIPDETTRRYNEIGGRLYCTAMATMILEVYYRHMPIYAKESTASGFPVE